MTFRLEPVPTATFAVVAASWIVFCIVFLGRSLRRREAGTQKAEPASRLGVLLQMAGFALLWGLPRPPFTPIVPMPVAAQVAVGVLAAALAVFGVAFSVAAMRTLGREWSYTARLVENHRLVTGGPYRFVRHPIYTGMLSKFVATGIAWGHPLIFAIALAAFAAGTAIRVRAEEKLLREAFGEEYQEYARHVPAVVPGLG